MELGPVFFFAAMRERTTSPFSLEESEEFSLSLALKDSDKLASPPFLGEWKGRHARIPNPSPPFYCER